MKVEDDTREIPIGEPGHSRDAPLTSDLGLWGTDAVQLGKENNERRSTASAPRTATKPRRWFALAALACTTSVITALGVNLVGGESGPQVERPQAAQTRRQLTADAPGTDRAKAARRAAHRQQQARLRSRKRSIDPSHPTHPAPSPTHAPTPEPAPAPEPVAPSPAPAPASAPAHTAKPPPASGQAVAEEFGFER